MTDLLKKATLTEKPDNLREWSLDYLSTCEVAPTVHGLVNQMWVNHDRITHELCKNIVKYLLQDGTLALDEDWRVIISPAKVTKIDAGTISSDHIAAARISAEDPPPQPPTEGTFVGGKPLQHLVHERYESDTFKDELELIQRIKRAGIDLDKVE